jgi:hypothetical protein
MPKGTLEMTTPLPVKLGDIVEFHVESQGVPNPRVDVLAYQDGVLVYGEANGPSKDGHVQFELGGGASNWKTNGGPADCEARLYYFKSGQPITTVYLDGPINFPADG